MTNVETDRGESLATFYVEKQPWVKRSKCLGADTELFFDDELAALDICKQCPVRRECGEQALVEEGNAPYGRYGVRGCMTAAQREVVHRRGGLKGHDPKWLVAGRKGPAGHGPRAFPAIPLDGIPWSRHHTGLIRRVVAHLDDGYNVGGTVRLARLCAALDASPVPMKHVLTELWAIGILDKTSGYVYRGGELDSSLARSRADN